MSILEEWKIINEFPDYKISNFGRLKRGKNNVVPIFLDKDGYYQTTLWKNDKRYFKRIHDLVSKHWCNNKINEKLETDHINRNRRDNYFLNFRLVTKEVNLKNRVFNKAR